MQREVFAKQVQKRPEGLFAKALSAHSAKTEFSRLAPEESRIF